MKIAITGAAGFLGGDVLRAARERGHAARAVVRPGHAVPGCEDVVRVDLGVGGSLVESLTGCDAVVHSAGRVGWGSEAEYERDNATATGEVALAAAELGIRLVHVSSTAVYGDRAPERGSVTEDSPLGYRLGRWDRYARSKIAAEGALGVPGLERVIVRPGFIFGPGDRNTGAFLDLLRRGAAPLVGRGHNRLPLTFVRSVSDALLLAAEHPDAAGRAYNVARDWPVSQRQFLKALASAAGLHALLLPLPYRLFAAAGLAAEAGAGALGAEPPFSRSAAALLGLDADFPTARIEAELGWRPALPFDAAVAQAVTA